MRFLVRSAYGESLGICLRLLDEGHDVQMSIKSDQAKEVGDGLVEKASDFESASRRADIVIFDSNGAELPQEAETVSRIRPVFGSSALAGQLENDRKFATEVAKKAGLTVSRSMEFSGPRAWQRARDFLRQRDKAEKWVWKPYQDQGEPPASTYCAETISELFRMLSYWEGLKWDGPASFLLMPKIEGVEVSTEGWFNGQDFIPSLANHTIEKNRLFPGDLGEKTGCAGNVVWLEESKLYKELIPRFSTVLRDKYRGPFDINCIIDSEGDPHFLEFTPRLGYDAIFALFEVVENFGQLVASAVGLEQSTPVVKQEFAGAVRVNVPPYPESSSKESKTEATGLPIIGYDVDKYSRHQHLVEARVRQPNDQPETSGPNGYVFVASGTGGVVSESIKSAYSHLEELRVPNMRYRNDLDEGLQECYNKLEATGWIEGNEKPEPISVHDIFGGSRRRF